jgi:molecular chaperone IbpA
MMANIDFSPLFQSSIGFDHAFDLLDKAARVHSLENWPPYDIEKTGEDRYRITMAVAGFSPDELEMTKHANLLVVSGSKAEKEERAQVLHRGIATRGFQRRFQLADYVEVAGADLADGLLVIDLVREVPEAMKPKRITVQTGLRAAGGEPQQVEQKQAA